ncbi:hypothetical protein [Nocardia rhamnosiphila]|uniref:Extradiol ring-cleavage dioxygenase class III enzyme subunit B domain-containing protein n=1 Tax=Nocardia rhamnosiphila TaxID=426716 RepID=A0ABV2WI57_9NOCA
MASISLAVAASHAPGLTGWFDKAPAADRETVRRAYDAIHDEIAAADLDALLIIGNDHVANTRVGDPWDFSFGLTDRHTGPDEWFKPWLRVADYDLRGAPDIAQTLFESVRDSGPRVRGVRDRLRFDDNVSVPVTMAGLAALDVPVIPILQNCTVPPVPDERVCYDFGKALGRAIAEDLPADARIGLFGSGGLSHEPGGPRYLEIDEKFDRWYMDLLAAGDHERILTEATFQRMEAAGSGGTAELLSWTVVLGAVGPRPCTDLGYVAVDQWRCGVGAVRWTV